MNKYLTTYNYKNENLEKIKSNESNDFNIYDSFKEMIIDLLNLTIPIAIIYSIVFSIIFCV